jgi:hypothetical protein
MSLWAFWLCCIAGLLLLLLLLLCCYKNNIGAQSHRAPDRQHILTDLTTAYRSMIM